MENYQQVQLTRFDQSERIVGRHTLQPAVRKGLVRLIGETLPANEQGSYWNVEIIADSGERSDLNFNDYFDTGKPVFTILLNVKADPDASYQDGESVTVQMLGPCVASNHLETSLNPDEGYILATGHAVIRQQDGGGMTCEQSFYMQGTYYG